MTTDMINNISRINKCFMEFRVKISGKSFVKKSDALIGNGATAFKASKGSITGSKKLMQSRELKDCKNSESALRNLIRANTISLGEYEVISPKRFIKVKEEFNKLLDIHRNNIEAFIKALPRIQKDDEINLGTLYCAADYPSPEEIKQSFSVNWVVKPLPDMSSFNIQGLDVDDVQMLSSRLDDSVKADIKEMACDMLKKILYGKNPDANNIVVEGDEIKFGNGLHYALYRLSNYDEKTSTFKQNTIDNVFEVCEVVEDLNALNDPAINKVCDNLKRLFNKRADILRDDDKERAEVIDKAQDSIDEIEEMMRGFV